MFTFQKSEFDVYGMLLKVFLYMEKIGENTSEHCWCTGNVKQLQEVCLNEDLLWKI
jgi:hypothetical protein